MRCVVVFIVRLHVIYVRSLHVRNPDTCLMYRESHRDEVSSVAHVVMVLRTFVLVAVPCLRWRPKVQRVPVQGTSHHRSPTWAKHSTDSLFVGTRAKGGLGVEFRGDLRGQWVVLALRAMS